jgi:hypothetical protein
MRPGRIRQPRRAAQHPARDGQQPQRGQRRPACSAERQNELRDKLQSLIDRFIEGGEPDESKGAQEAMRDAKEAIGEGNLTAPPPASRSTSCAKGRSPWPSR